MYSILSCTHSLSLSLSLSGFTASIMCKHFTCKINICPIACCASFLLIFYRTVLMMHVTNQQYLQELVGFFLNQDSVLSWKFNYHNFCKLFINLLFIRGHRNLDFHGLERRLPIDTIGYFWRPPSKTPTYTLRCRHCGQHWLIQHGTNYNQYKRRPHLAELVMTKHKSRHIVQCFVCVPTVRQRWLKQ